MSPEASYFAEGSLPRRMVAFSAPLVAANLLQYLYQFVDMAIVGHAAGEVALVSVSNASSVAFARIRRETFQGQGVVPIYALKGIRGV